MKLSKEGQEFIQKSEGLSLVVYNDVAGYPTIGYGHLIKKGEEFGVLTQEQAQALFETDVSPFEECVTEHVTVDLTQWQFDSLVSFTYNLGEGNFKSSTLLKKLNAGLYDDAGRELLKWDRAGGQVVAGLLVRRGRELNMFLGNTQEV